jgi:hypothetical protein
MLYSKPFNLQGGYAFLLKNVAEKNILILMEEKKNMIATKKINSLTLVTTKSRDSD